MNFLKERLKKLQKRAGTLDEELDAILGEAGSDPLDEEQRTEYEKLENELDSVEDEIRRTKDRIEKNDKRS